MLFHCLIVPCFERSLTACLKSIHASAANCNIQAYRVFICDGGSKVVHKPSHRETVVPCQGLEPVRLLPNENRPYNKARCLNAGIEAAVASAGAKDCVLTFLDADAIVGVRFMAGAMNAMKYDRVMYRVSRAGKPWGETPISYEAYSHPDDDWSFRIRLNPPVMPEPGMAPQGNSQFSILKTKLNEVRFNENYFGRSFEDLWMMRELYRRGLNNTTIHTDEDHAMFHVPVAASKHFDAGRWSDRNYRMYHNKQTTWVIGTNRRLLEKFSNALHLMPGSSKAGCRFVERDDFAENIYQEVAPACDKFVFLDRSRMMGNQSCPTMIVDGEMELKMSWEQVITWMGLKPAMKDLEAARESLG